ncbi:MAG: site-specific DNA-methyltransferase [Rhodospirillales bacterium]
MPVRKLLYGDNLTYLRDMASASVDLVYLDPPFNSNASYNVLFRSPSGMGADAQIQAFEDTWHWTEETQFTLDGLMRQASPAAGVLRALRALLGENDMMAYLVMMTARLIEARRLLKPSGNLILHCDPTASHYLKIILDGIFDARNFRNEVVWQRTGAKSNTAKRFAGNHDILLLYGAGEGAYWDAAASWCKPDPTHLDPKIARRFRYDDGDGRRYQLCDLTNPSRDRPNLTYEFLGVTKVWRWTEDRMSQALAEGRISQAGTGRVPRYKQYLDEARGQPVGDVWTDIGPLNSQSRERLGYPTQKPVRLLERLIRATTPPGGLVLDPFCGCGTTVHAAENLGRNWIGIDITHLAIQVVETRMKHAHPRLGIQVEGRPTTIQGAEELARRCKHQFELWAVWLADGIPRGGGRKGPDRGVDGDLYFKVGARQDAHAVISVKGGKNLCPAMIRDLNGTRAREQADLGIFISLVKPSRDMLRDAASMDMLETDHLVLPRIQIFTIEDLLAGKRPQAGPPYDLVTAAGRDRRCRQRNPAKLPDPRQREILYPIRRRVSPEGPAIPLIPRYLRYHAKV